MQQWEYANIHVYSSDVAAGANGETDANAGGTYGYWGTDVAGYHLPVGDVLAELGDAGWELCSSVLAGLITLREGVHAAGHILYLRRPKAPAPGC